MRLAKLAEIEGQTIVIEWRSFLLRPEPEERSMESFTRYTHSWERPAELEPSAGFVVPWSGEHEPPSHSLPAAIASRVAATFGGPWAAYHGALLHAYFVEHRTISNFDVLIDLAGRVGIDPHEFAERFHSGANDYARQSIDDHNTAVEAGIGGVPAVVVDGRYLVSGAVDVEEYQNVLERVRAERAASG
ncbi:MAG: DsbA family protein [Actinomycetia bacterium]|nr:DsbA family protein [Actinomycetes bacterium]MCP4962927.1 DsbA family protein [Actinomycetes bacterium]